MSRAVVRLRPGKETHPLVRIAQVGNLLMGKVCEHLLTNGYGSCAIVEQVTLDRRGFVVVEFNDGSDPLLLAEWS